MQSVLNVVVEKITTGSTKLRYRLLGPHSNIAEYKLHQLGSNMRGKWNPRKEMGEALQGGPNDWLGFRIQRRCAAAPSREVMRHGIERRRVRR